jgi:rod shape-determining protein MreC
MMLWLDETRLKVFYLPLPILSPLQNWKIKDKQPYDIVVSKVIHNSYNVHENYLL